MDQGADANNDDDDDDDDSGDINHDIAMPAHLWMANNKSVLEDISCWHLKLISNFSKAANKSLPGLVKTNANVCPAIPLLWYFSTEGQPLL